ncbi:MAG: exodeoxyribonuclease VII large subunit [Parachlamydiaceae bacterium]|nr:exodeoxyribonuclease VII large subunit [Parachlamydiaceae bacterium]
MNPHGPPILSVTQLSNAIKYSLEATFPQIWLQGEVSNFKAQSSGHLYFSLKDAGAQISAVMFRASAATLKALPKDGAQVIVQGEINVYPPSGKYQLLVKELRLVGLGELLLKLEELKAKLHAKGWFNAEHKKPLPRFPRCIGVITSPTGAAIHDILNVLTHRFSGFKLMLNPVRVQGEGAAAEIVAAIEFFNRYKLADVLIVGRGGGSIEDLWAFNEEIVAAAIFASKIPIISAVGHETDICLSDFVADVRAPTPSAAAMMVIAEKEQQLVQLDHWKKRLVHCVRLLIKHDRQKLLGITRHPLFSSPYGLLGYWFQRTDDLRQSFDLSVRQTLIRQRNFLIAQHRQLQLLRPTARIAQFKEKLESLGRAIRKTVVSKVATLEHAIKQMDYKLKMSWRSHQLGRRKMFSAIGLQRQIDQVIQRTIVLRKERLKGMSASLHSIDPKNVLKRGYSILFNEIDDCVITSVITVKPGHKVKLLLADGKILTTANEVLKNEYSQS